MGGQSAACAARSMKGVSPIIATILLIAVAISLGVMITGWATQMANRQMSGTDSCVINTMYIIDSVEFNKSTTLNNTLLVKITNKGTEKLYGFGAILDNGTYIVQMNSSSSLIGQGGISSGYKLERERTTYITINLTDTSAGYTTMGSTLTSVKITNDGCPGVSASTSTITK